MPYRIYDYRADIRNLEITPQIRTRFIRLVPGEVHVRHSHDLGHEVFLVMEGLAEIEIAGERAVLGPGQLCVVPAMQRHQVRNAGEGPLVMYLSVSPHVEPTHTFWSEDGEGDERLPPRYGSATGETAGSAPAAPPLAELAATQQAAMQQLLHTVRAAAAAHDRLLGQITAGGAEPHTGDGQAALKATVDALWTALGPVFHDVAALTAAWNELAVTAGSTS